MATIDCTTLARVKTHLGGISGTGLDGLLDQIIDSVSSQFEKYLRRKLKAEAFTEVVHLRSGKKVVSLPAFPLTAVTSLKFSLTTDFTASTAMATTAYAVDLEGGFIRFTPLGHAPFFDAGFLQVIGTGGMGADTTAFTAAFPDIAQAADEQCAYEYMRKTNPGGNITFAGGSTQHTGELDLLKGVLRTLAMHRRQTV